MRVVCGKTGAELLDDGLDDDEEESGQVLYDTAEDESNERPFYWSNALQMSFREELEK